MGKLKKWRKEHPRFPEEEPNSRPSLAGEAAGWLDSKPPAARRMLQAAGLALAAAAVIATAALAVGAAYSPASEQEAQGDASFADSSAAKSEASQYANCFQNVGYWTFLRSPATIAKVEDGIYGQLLASGLSEGEFVSVYEGFDQTDTGYTGYFRDTPRGKYWKCAFEAGTWDVRITEATEADMPRPAGADQIQEDPWESQGAAAADSFAQGQSAASAAATPDSQQQAQQQSQQQAASTSSDDGIGPSNGTALSDQSALDALLPKAAAATVSGTLIDGAQSSYGVKAAASSSYILNSSVKASGQNCGFRVKLAEAGGKSVVLDVSYDSSTGRFTGTKVS